MATGAQDFSVNDAGRRDQSLKNNNPTLGLLKIIVYLCQRLIRPRRRRTVCETTIATAGELTGVSDGGGEKIIAKVVALLAGRLRLSK